MARGFDFYDDAFSAETFKKKDIGLVDRKAEESVTHAIGWLKKTPHRPFFLWLHLYDPHSPYDPPEPYRSQYRDHPYDGEIAYADHELGRLLTWLKANQLYSRTLIVFLSDHGESLGEHGEGEHGFFIYNATIRVPLIVKPPAGSRFRPTRVSAPVETVGVPATLFQLAGVKDPIQKQFQAVSLLYRPRDNETPAYSETFYPFSSFGWSPLHALETSRYHYVDAPKPELYDVVADPEEKNNIAPQQTATVAVLKDKLQQKLRENPFPKSQAESQLTPEAAEKLRALGYMAYHAPVSAAALAAGLPDPKDKLWEFNGILKAGDAFHIGDFETGQNLLAQVREKDPQMYVVPFMLGEAALRRQNWQEAAASFQKCLEFNPDFEQAITGLAHALFRLGNNTEAQQWLVKALQYNPQNYRAWYETGLLDAGSNPAAALSAYQKAVTVQPNFYPGQRELGMALFNQKDYIAAAPHLEKAISLGLEDAHLHNYLGICYSRTNRLEKAVRSYRVALKLDPSLAEAHLNLAFALQRMQEPAAALTQYREACTLEEKFCELMPQR